MNSFFALLQSASTNMRRHQVSEDADKDYGRQETRHWLGVDALECLPNPRRWPDMRSFTVIETTREGNGKVSQERLCYISKLPSDTLALARTIRQYWRVDNPVYQY